MTHIFTALILIFCNQIHAGEATHISVGSAKSKKSVIAFAPIKSGPSPSEMQLSKTIIDTVTKDLEFLDMFKFLNPSAFIEKSQTAGVANGSFKYGDWKSIGADLLIKALSTVKGQNLVVESHLFDVPGGKELLGKRYTARTGEVVTLAHTIADDIASTLTGSKGIFLTKIVMNCDRETRNKEIYIMDYDGSNIKQVTHHKSVSFAPAWSPDGTKMIYSMFAKNKKNIKNINLYEFDFISSTVKMLSNRSGINSGASYAPNGKSLILTMSFLGTPEIFSLNPAAQTVKKITVGDSLDVDPVYNPDGNKIAFVSSRTGKPMVHVMNADGSDVKRLTFAGKYNAAPAWSPDGRKIAFAGWIDSVFDIFMMNSDGTNIERLTKGQGSNENPHFSPDGNFIVFNSNRTGKQNIYAMNVDGTMVRRITYGMGACENPKWSAPPKAHF